MSLLLINDCLGDVSLAGNQLQDVACVLVLVLLSYQVDLLRSHVGPAEVVHIFQVRVWICILDLVLHFSMELSVFEFFLDLPLVLPDLLVLVVVEVVHLIQVELNHLLLLTLQLWNVQLSQLVHNFVSFLHQHGQVNWVLELHSSLLLVRLSSILVLICLRVLEVLLRRRNIRVVLRVLLRRVLHFFFFSKRKAVDITLH